MYFGYRVLDQYFDIFGGDFSHKQEDWDAFGSLFGGVIGSVLSFIAVVVAVYTLRLQQEDSNINRFESAFFELLSNQQTLLSSVIYDDDKNESGIIAIKTLVQEFNSTTYGELEKLYKDLVSKDIKQLDREHLPYLKSKLGSNAVSPWNQIRNKLTQPVDTLSFEQLVEGFSKLDEPYINQIRNKIFNSDKAENITPQILFEKYCLLNSSIKEKQGFLERGLTNFYQDRGGEYGFYFRSLSHLLLFIDQGRIPKKEKFKYAKILRSYLSRFEIAFLYYNCISEKTSKEFNTLVNKYDLLNGLHETDLFDNLNWSEILEAKTASLDIKTHKLTLKSFIKDSVNRFNGYIQESL